MHVIISHVLLLPIFKKNKIFGILKYSQKSTFTVKKRIESH